MATEHNHSACDHGSGGNCCCCNSDVLRGFYADASESFVSRRNLLLGMGSAAIGGWALTSARSARAAESAGGTVSAIKPSGKLIVQPALTYALPRRAEQTSWRHWGGLMEQADVDGEIARINQELQEFATASRIPLEVRPVQAVNNAEQAKKLAEQPCDVMLIYAGGGDQNLLESLLKPDRPSIFFLRHRSGPVSLWYEILHPRFLRKNGDQYRQAGVTVDDVVVDEYADLAWRLRSLLGLRRTVGQRIVAIGGPAGWGEGHGIAPKIAREKWHLDIVDYSYEKLAEKIKAAQADTKLVSAAVEQAGRYLADPNVSCEIDRKYVDNAFVLYQVIKNLMDEHEATAMTVNHCMGTIMPMSQTTACLPLTLLNDEGLLAFCESDFVVIPSGMLMHHITGLPVFLNDPTWPHHGVVTLAHCTAPRKMNGQSYEPVRILSHFESDYGAAPKVEMTVGQRVTMVVPDFASHKWVGCVGSIVENPFLPICRSQIDVAIDGDWPALVRDMRGFHWMMVYGDCRQEIGYAIRRLGIEWQDVSATAAIV